MELQFFPLDIEYRVFYNKPSVFIYGRSIDGKQILVIDDTFKPYFYVLPKSNVYLESLVEKLKKQRFKLKDDYFTIQSIQEEKKKNHQIEKNLLKIILRYPQEISVVAKELKFWEEIEEVIEEDILFLRKYVLDNNITPFVLTNVVGEQVNFRSKALAIKASFIEQVSTEVLKEPRVMAIRVTGLSKHRIVQDEPIEIISLVYGEVRKTITYKDIEAENVEKVDSEIDLLRRFYEHFEAYKPEFLVGLNSDRYDLFMLKKRAQKYGLSFYLGVDFSDLNITAKALPVSRITGIVHFDLLKFINAYSYVTVEDYYRSFVDFCKNYFPGLSIIDEKNKFEKDKLLHTQKITQLIYDLFLKLFANVVELGKITLEFPFEISRISVSRIVESYLETQCCYYKEIIKKKPTFADIIKRKNESYKGGIVLEPIPGIYDTTAVFDFRSMYPNIIISHNISFDTINCDCCIENAPKIKLEKKVVHFCKKRKGLLPYMLESLIERRSRILNILKSNEEGKKNIFLEARADVLKLIANSIPGYLVFPSARFYCNYCIEAVTELGRVYINRVIEDAKKEGFSIMYGDTDLVFVTKPEITLDDVKKFQKKMNNELPPTMELELQGLYKKSMFVSTKSSETGAKKKYVLLDNRGYLVIKGFECVRKNVPIITKQCQLKVIKYVLKNMVEEAVEYFRKVMEDLENMRINKRKLILSTELSKNIGEYETIAPYVAVAKRLQSQGRKIYPGYQVRYIICKVDEYEDKISEKAKLPEECQAYDADYYIYNQILPAVENIFELVGVKREHLLKQKEQKMLDGFIN